MNDWRLTNQKKYLDKVVLEKSEYNLSEHNHCEFCWYEFIGGDIGYTTEDKYYWICEQCFSDFYNDFKWALNKSEK